MNAITKTRKRKKHEKDNSRRGAETQREREGKRMG
jgi:hypothetical protein